MLHLMKIEWQKLRVPVLSATLASTLVMCVLSCTLYQNYSLLYDLQAWEVGTELFSLFYPLLVVLPLCWNLYAERKNNFLVYVLPRTPLKGYLTAKWLVYALGAFSLLFFPYVLSAIAALYVKAPLVPYVTDGYATPFTHVFLNTFTQRPLLYAALLSFWRGLLGVLTMSFGFVLALYSKNIFVILTGPFIYTILENFILSILRLEKYRLITAFDPTSLSSGAVSFSSLVMGPVLLSLVLGLSVFFLVKVKKNTVVSL